MELFRCPTCLSILEDPRAERCPLCRQRLQRKAPIVLTGGERPGEGVTLPKLPGRRWRRRRHFGARSDAS